MRSSHIIDSLGIHVTCYVCLVCSNASSRVPLTAAAGVVPRSSSPTKSKNTRYLTTCSGQASIFLFYRCTRLVSVPSLVRIPALQTRVSCTSTWQPLSTHSIATPQPRISFVCYHARQCRRQCLAGSCFSGPWHLLPLMLLLVAPAHSDRAHRLTPSL